MNQEDAHRIELALSNHPNFQFFGVFDGHGGGEASKYIEKNLAPKLNDLKTFDDETLRCVVACSLRCALHGAFPNSTTRV